MNPEWGQEGRANENAHLAAKFCMHNPKEGGGGVYKQ
jgi:hypothetical protein